jgi:hypothetical protein
MRAATDLAPGSPFHVPERPVLWERRRCRALRIPGADEVVSARTEGGRRKVLRA